MLHKRYHSYKCNLEQQQRKRLIDMRYFVWVSTFSFLSSLVGGATNWSTDSVTSIQERTAAPSDAPPPAFTLETLFPFKLIFAMNSFYDDGSISSESKPQRNLLKKECKKGTDCDTDDQCSEGLLCADIYKPELRSLGYDDHHVYCDIPGNATDGKEVCFDPKKVNGFHDLLNITYSPTVTPSSSPTITPSSFKKDSTLTETDNNQNWVLYFFSSSLFFTFALCCCWCATTTTTKCRPIRYFTTSYGASNMSSISSLHEWFAASTADAVPTFQIEMVDSSESNIAVIDGNDGCVTDRFSAIWRDNDKDMDATSSCSSDNSSDTAGDRSYSCVSV